MTKRVVVTGATGYIAGHIIKKLLHKGYVVVAIVRDKNNQSKYQHLLDLLKEDGVTGRLEVESGDLETANYLEIFKGADGVIHTASPYIYTAEDPENNIVKPAIAGNIRVLEAANKIPSIKKVVITSSTAAITDLKNHKDVYDESDWNSTSDINSPYQYSKYLAEKKAWEFKKETSDQSKHYQLIVINPAFVLGPALSNHLNTSINTFEQSIRGVGSSLGNRFVGLVDVRDVADAHITALESTQDLDGERKLLSNTVLSFTQIGQQVKELFPNLEVLKVIDTTGLKPPLPYKLVSKSKLVLEHPFIDFSITLQDTVNYLLKSNNLKLN